MRAAVNRLVAGSNPARGAKRFKSLGGRRVRRKAGGGRKIGGTIWGTAPGG